VRVAGGIPVLAHPSAWWEVMPVGFEAILDELHGYGIEGIECYYPSNSAELTELCVNYCREHGMVITCGGDGHGGFNNVGGGVVYDIGIVKTDINKLNLGGILN
jgi:hypothetical protein